MNQASSFGAFVRQRRRELDLTQDELARRVGCAGRARGDGAGGGGRGSRAAPRGGLRGGGGGARGAPQSLVVPNRRAQFPARGDSDPVEIGVFSSACSAAPRAYHTSFGGGEHNHDAAGLIIVLP